MSITIVRHGESIWNKQNLFTGFMDVELSENGIEEANKCGLELKTNNIIYDFAITSSLQRAYNTCEIIKNHLGYDLNTTKTESLNERDYGDLTGKNKKEMVIEYGEEQVQLWRRSVEVKPPNGENLLDVIKRVSVYCNQFILPLVEKGKNILIVAHGNSIRALLVVLNIFDLNVISNFEIPTGKPMYINEMNYSFINDYKIHGRQILDSRGNPTIEAELTNKNNKIIARGAAPSGASTGSNEAVELRDNKLDLYMGKSVFSAINNLLTLNYKMYLDDKTLKNVIKCDNQIMFIDGTELKKNLGGNATTAASFLFAEAGASLCELELFEYLSNVYGYSQEKKEMPIPMVNILNGGKHAGGNLKIQEFMIMPTDKVDFSHRVEYVFRVYNNLKKLLKNKYGPSSTNLGDEGGFAPNLNTADEALIMLEEAVKESNLILGEDIYLALDCAASEFYDKETERYEIECGKFLSSVELCQYYQDLITRHPALKSIEDAFDEKDYNGWKLFTRKCGDEIMIVGDDLFTTNPELIKIGMQHQWANSLLLKVNQIGTITEAVEAAKLMQKKNCDVIVSHRSGETNSTLIADLAVAINAKYIKLGAPARGERVAKFNRLLQIQELI
jgi:enolase